VQLNDGWQSQLDFELPGWQLTFVPADERDDPANFPAGIVKAVPLQPDWNADDVEDLYRRLFLLLGFIACREVGIGPVCGFDVAGDLCWVEWANMRMRPGKTAARWCSRRAAASALPLLAKGLAGLAGDPQVEKVVDRGINHVFATNGEEVLDVRVPIACSGIELLAWAVLQRHGHLGRKVLERMSAASMAERLLDWAGIPTTLPSELKALDARRNNRDPNWVGPDILFNVRNNLVHPPPRLTDAEWATPDELVEAYKLAAWYLELALLRLLGYEGKYWSRLREGHSAADLELVPWAVT
jgi:hypothetical protein